MAKSNTSRSAFAVLDSFDIVKPGGEESVLLSDVCTVTVEVNDTGSHDSFAALIYGVCVDDAHVPPLSACLKLTNVGGTTWRGDFDVGFLDPFDILEAMKQVIVYGVITDGGVQSFAKTRKFRINRGGSGAIPCSTVYPQGSGGSQCGNTGSGMQACGFCSAQPVPYCLTLKNAGGAISNGAECNFCGNLNFDFPLQHSDDSCFTCCWFSRDVSFCGGDSTGYWRLEKKDARLWELGVYYSQSGTQSFPIVLYQVSTTSDNYCRFPITLTLVPNSADNACSNWPNTILVEAAQP